ncbi:hypothetical protein [Chryseobacterium indologenes]|uniref:hypothetical protein n=1 Tax=Chryseobacterium indologenes TaxID=253 RepID=UPI0030177C68
METNKLLNRFESLLKKHRNAKYTCSFSGCEEKSIKSHVLQKNGILKNIAEKQHLAQFSSKSIFNSNNNSRFELRNTGINDVYTFPGFCKKHDDEIFSFIENNKLDFNNRITHALFAYRAICQEIYRKKSSLNTSTEILMSKDFSHDFKLLFADLRKGYEHGINNLLYFKRILEKEINGENSDFIFNYVEFDKIDVCISAPLNIFDKENPLSYTFDNNLKSINEIYVTSVINIFPYHEKSYFLIATNKGFECKWTENIFNLFKNFDSQNRLKIISDLLTTRFEFWCISIKLQKMIGSKKISELCEIWQSEILNFDENIQTDFNLFENYIVHK